MQYQTIENNFDKDEEEEEEEEEDDQLRM